jgi:NADH:ubiquinone oxidoreductase subunit 2 (subunit N)
LVIIGSILITTLVQNNITQEVSRERIVFTLCAILGGIILNSATDFLTILLGLELQSYSVYILAASYRNYEPSEAAGLKYFLLGALSSALVFMGLAILYAYSGSTNLDHAFLMISLNQNDIILPYAGTILILAGIS